MAEKIKNGLFVFAFTIILLPFLQQQTKIIDSGTLNGYFTSTADIPITLSKWLNGSWQANKANFINDSIGFRPDFVRLNGQLDYSLFGKLEGGIKLGKKGCLFFDDIVNAYYGRDFVGYDFIRERMRKLKALQDTLAGLGKTLLMVYTPCKAWYFADCIPEVMRTPEFGPNNYKTSFRIGDSLGINQVDLNEWFLSLKSSSKELLYSGQGIHWTNYGAILGSDSIIKCIERLRHISMPHPTWTTSLHTTEPQMPDNDMTVILNLILPYRKDTFCYPDLKFTTGDGLTKPNCIFLGDSYIVNLINTEVIRNISADWQCWLWCKQLVNESNWQSSVQYQMPKDYDWKKAIDSTDCLILMNTPKSASLIGFSFIEQAYNYFYPGNK